MLIRGKFLSLVTIILPLLSANPSDASEISKGDERSYSGSLTQGQSPAENELRETQSLSVTRKADGIEVVSSDWFTVENSPAGEWSSTPGFNLPFLFFDFPVPELTREILDTGIVIVKADLAGYNSAIWESGKISNLPITLMYIQSGEPDIDNWDYRLSEGSIRISFQNSKDSYGTLSSAHRFRYVIVPKTVSAEIFRDRFELQ